MSFKEWGVPLPDGFHILVERINKRGKITGFTVVLIYDGECVSRYDTAHNAAHRDILGKTQGLIAKEGTHECDQRL
jgi:hypothetical protein